MSTWQILESERHTLNLGAGPGPPLTARLEEGDDKEVEDVPLVMQMHITHVFCDISCELRLSEMNWVSSSSTAMKVIYVRLIHISNKDLYVVPM